MARRKHSESAKLAKDIGHLKEVYRWAVDQRGGNVFTRQTLNTDTRDAYWSGQSADGKKHKQFYGGEVFPYEGASDARIPLIDRYTNEDVALLMNVFGRMRISVAPTEATDADRAGHMTHYLRWLIREQISELRDEAQYLANYYLEHGSAVLGVYWKRQRALETKYITMAELEAQSMQARQALGAGQPMDPQTHRSAELMALLPGLIKNSAEEDRLISLVHPLFKGVLQAQQVRTLIRELRETGEGSYQSPYIRDNRPCVEALQPNQDIFIPQEEKSMRDARFIFRRELISETQLKDRVKTHEWSGKWVGNIIEKHRGKYSADDRGRVRRSHRGRTGTNDGDRQLFEVIHAYRRLYDQAGVEGIYHTVFHPGNEEDLGYHQLQRYQHGQLPFVHFKREHRTKHPDSSRGYGEIGSTWQSTIKTQVDMRTDRTVLATNPPSYHPPEEEPAEWGPGVQIPTLRPDRFGWFDAPKHDRGSEEVQSTMTDLAAAYYGRPLKDGSNAMDAQNLRQHLSENWMAGWKDASTQILQLSQQYEKEEIYYRRIGSAKGQSVRATRSEIQGKFDLTVTFNVQMLMPEYQKDILGVVEKALAVDTDGLVDRAEILEYLFENAMPGLSERFLHEPQQRAQSEIEDEQDVLAKLRAGIPVDVKEGQNHGLRLNFIQELFQNSPAFQEELQSNPTYAEQVETRVKQLSHQQEQMTTNRAAGQLGATYGQQGGRPSR